MSILLFVGVVTDDHHEKDGKKNHASDSKGWCWWTGSSRLFFCVRFFTEPGFRYPYGFYQFFGNGNAWRVAFWFRGQSSTVSSF
jgi:hypothetical protein